MYTYILSYNKKKKKQAVDGWTDNNSERSKKNNGYNTCNICRAQTKCYAVRERKPRESIKIKAVVSVNEKSYMVVGGGQSEVYVCVQIYKK